MTSPSIYVLVPLIASVLDGVALAQHPPASLERLRDRSRGTKIVERCRSI